MVVVKHIKGNGMSGVKWCSETGVTKREKVYGGLGNSNRLTTEGPVRGSVQGHLVEAGLANVSASWRQMRHS